MAAWVERVKAHDESAAFRLWEDFFQPLVERASRKLANQRVRRVVDAEDAVAAAFGSFFRRAEEGRFPNILNRDDLWSLLMTITDRKCANLIRHERAMVRGQGKVRGDSIAEQDDSDSPLGIGMDMFHGNRMRPDVELAVEETFGNLLAVLEGHDPELAVIALMRMEGWSNHEIADRLEKSVATVERRLKLIRELWRSFAPGLPPDGAD